MMKRSSLSWSGPVLMLLVLAHLASGEIGCNEAVTQLLPCEAYLLGAEANPSAGCCGGVQSLGTVAMGSVENRRAICRCFKNTAKSLPINVAKAESLPQLCKVTISIAINPSVDCDSL